MRFDEHRSWQGERVTLFPLTLGNVSEEYVRWLNDKAVNQFLECRFSEHSLHSTHEFVQHCLDDSSALLLGIRAGHLAGRHVGNIKVGPVDRNHETAEVGILIGDRDAWGKGIATDAIQVVKHVAKHELMLRRITAGCYQSNVGSWKAFTKAGFTIEGERPGHFLLNGKPESLLLMGCTLG